jgi:hypothetical protein
MLTQFHNHDRLRIEHQRAASEILRIERAMAAEERRLERKLEELENTQQRVKAVIEAEWRREHFGHNPARPPAWRVDQEMGADQLRPAPDTSRTRRGKPVAAPGPLVPAP